MALIMLVVIAIGVGFSLMREEPKEIVAEDIEILAVGDTIGNQIETAVRKKGKTKKTKSRAGKRKKTVPKKRNPLDEEVRWNNLKY